ncbi:MAG: cupin domain-containing protein [Pseudomonadota bacterium]
MEIMPAGSRPTQAANPAYFTGTVLQDPVIAAPDGTRLHALIVHFAPGARTHWHTHPHGQTLQVLSGVGRVQLAGEPLREIRAGDTVWIAPGERHWHGAAPGVAMTHLAIQEAGEDGMAAHWAEPVDEATANATPA